ncbi:hypothetical protein [Vibrio sp. TRT 17S01]|uniref:hypothetical protein n=1 Tax=Vibrio sp. TRT 17S01 TaxID=3418505 RepID=UPI003CE98F30
MERINHPSPAELELLAKVKDSKRPMAMDEFFQALELSYKYDLPTEESKQTVAN